MHFKLNDPGDDKKTTKGTSLQVKESYLKGSLFQSSLDQMAAWLLWAWKAHVREWGDFSVLSALGKNGVNMQSERRTGAEVHS